MKQNEIAAFCKKAVNFGFYSLAFFSAISISATQIALSIILLSWIILMVIEKRLIFAQTPLNYPFLIYFCIVITAALLGIDFSHSAKAIHKLWIALTFFAMLTFIEDIRMVKRLIYILLIVTSITSIYGVLQHIFPGLDIARPEGRKVVQWTAEGGVASTGFFDHHMTYGGFLLLVFSLSFSLSLSRVQQTVKNKHFFSLHTALPSILIFAGLISSMTRNAWMGAVFAVIFIVILKVKRKIIAFSVIGSIFLFLTAYCLMPTAYSLQSPLFNRFKSIFNISANIERLYIWKGTIDMIMEHPFGVGMDNYSKAINDYRGKYSHKFSDGSDAHAHNTILTQAAEHGIFGLAAFLWIWIVFFREGVKLHLSLLNTPNSEPHTSIILGGLGAVAGFHLAGMFENNFGDAEVATMMWFIVGLIFLMRKINVNPNLRNV
ncbi:MAG: O-antigen ligase family protein [Nitrospinae bacterium]|nr:O-antigen ligase family protein [Nitrospinota bacterium]